MSGRFTSYVRPGFAPLLIIGGAVLMAVGAVSLVLALRAEARADKAGSSTTRPESPGAPGSSAQSIRRQQRTRTATAPRRVEGAVADPRPGAGACSRRAARPRRTMRCRATPPRRGLPAWMCLTRGPRQFELVDGWLEGGYRFNDGSGCIGGVQESTRTQQFPPLPEGIEPALPIKDFVLRALYDADGSVDGVPVTVTGFVAPPGDGFADGYTIARIVISCCAADANPMRSIADTPPFPGHLGAGGRHRRPELRDPRPRDLPTVTVTSITPVDQPADPYEH